MSSNAPLPNRPLHPQGRETSAIGEALGLEPERVPHHRTVHGDLEGVAVRLDLAVEVLSESNTRAEMQRKLAEYFSAGTRLVWYLDPPNRAMAIYTSPSDSRMLGYDAVLDGGSVLPGLALPVASIFSVPIADDMTGT